MFGDSFLCSLKEKQRGGALGVPGGQLGSSIPQGKPALVIPGLGPACSDLAWEPLDPWPWRDLEQTDASPVSLHAAQRKCGPGKAPREDGLYSVLWDAALALWQGNAGRLALPGLSGMGEQEIAPSWAFPSHLQLRWAECVTACLASLQVPLGDCPERGLRSGEQRVPGCQQELEAPGYRWGGPRKKANADLPPE